MIPGSRLFAYSIAVIALAAVLASCGGSKRVVLDPVASRTRWLMGKNFVVVADSNAVVSVAFEREYNEQLQFDVEVVNLSGDTVLVDPVAIAYDIARDSTLARWNDTTVGAIDPEPMLRTIAGSREVEEADYSSHLTSRNVGDIVSGIATIVRATTDGDKSDEERRVADSAAEADRVNQLAGYIKRDDEHHATIAALNDLDRAWSAALRKTSLARRETIRGRVIFPAIRSARGLKVTVPIGGRSYVAEFRQRLE
jgi:hypothetical protein